MRLLAPAKINLHLRVGSRRNDGFHPLLSWMTTVGLFDTLELERARESGIVLATDKAEVPGDGRNLVVRAYDVFVKALRATQEGSAAAVTGLSAVLRKRIPIGSGLGGGSSDAARTLLALNLLWEADWSLPDLAALSARLGSDLPFFFHGPSSICTGRGEIVRPIDRPAPASALLIFPPFGVSTAAAYATFDEMGLGSDEAMAAEPDWKRWSALPAKELLALLINDLETAAFALHPRLSTLRGDLELHLGRVVRMSGSGSTLFTLFDSQDEAERAATVTLQTFRIQCHAAPIAPDVVDDVSKNQDRAQ
jgi:4-diphosphocytidyl-2-C-methyl-D-erythritol kinase